MGTDRPLTTKQQSIRSNFLGVGQPPPDFDPTIRDRLLDQLRHALAPAAERLDRKVVVNKHMLSSIHTCEMRWQAEDADTFSWSVQRLRGTVMHRAVERLIIGGYRDVPLDLVDTALRRMAEDDKPQGVASFLDDLDDDSRHDLIASAADAVTKFLADWPPISRKWLPRVESSRYFDLFEERLVLKAKFDLALGKPGGGGRTMIIDLKSGGQYPEHCEELRYYALVETLVAEAPPSRIGAYYLDSGTPWKEDPATTEAGLWAAAARVIDAVNALADITTGEREPSLSANPLCFRCPLLSSCAVGQVQVHRAAEHVG